MRRDPLDGARIPGTGAFPDSITRVIDDERRQQFMQEGAHFESEYFLTLTYLPPAESEQRAKGWMFEGGRLYSSSRTAQQTLEYFRSRVDAFENVFAQLFRTERLKRITVEDDSGDLILMTVCSVPAPLHQRRRPPFASPEFPCYLNEVLACEDFCGGIEPQIGRKHIRVIAIDGFPKMSSPGILRELDCSADRIPLEHASHSDRPGGGSRSARHASEEMAFTNPRLERSDSENPERRSQYPRAADGGRRGRGDGIAAAGDVQFAQYSREHHLP